MSEGVSISTTLAEWPGSRLTIAMSTAGFKITATRGFPWSYPSIAIEFDGTVGFDTAFSQLQLSCREQWK